MSDMESYQVCAGPPDQGGPADVVVVVEAESTEDACYRAGIVAMTERGLPAADYIVKSCVTQAEFMADQFRVPGYAALVAQDARYQSGVDDEPDWWLE